ncbi:MAG: Gfo/Idh/MocA family protein, partial [Terriglobia bacterium]
MADKTKSQLPKVAVVGMGYWGKNLVRNFHELGALATICDSSESVEADCRERYRNVRFCREFSEVLSDSDIGAVVLATPAMAHYAMAREAVLAGKDVFVEKPLAAEVWQGVELAKLAEANNRILMVGHILQY